MNIAEKVKNYYETEDFKDNYIECLFQDTCHCIDRIQQIAKSYEFENKYNTTLELSKIDAEKVLEYIHENIYEFIREFHHAYVGYTCIDSVSFGEQCEQLTGLYNHKTGKDYTLAYMKKVFESEDFYVSDGYAYYDMSYQGLYIDMLNASIPIIDEMIKEQNKVLS